jgi:hypothetical protein
MRNDGLEIVKGLTPSEMEEPASTVSIRGARNVGAPATLDNFALLLKKKTLVDGEKMDLFTVKVL